MLEISEISPHYHEKEGFCHPDWGAVFDVIEECVAEADRHEAWCVAAREWVKRLRDKLGGDYRVYETENFLILTEASKRIVKDVCRTCEDGLAQILQVLDGVASDEGEGKHVVLMLAELDDYYRYISYFHEQGDHPMSGGMCLEGEGYRHFVCPTEEYTAYRTVLIHELTHACLADLAIPVWLNEALAMRMEEFVCGSDIFHLDQELYEKHVSHWDERTIQQFWSGESWEIPGDSFELSYNLAQVLWRKIEGDLGAPREVLMQFCVSASFEDAGARGFHEVFGFALEGLVEEFLGEGNWAPGLFSSELPITM